MPRLDHTDRTACEENARDAVDRASKRLHKAGLSDLLGFDLDDDDPGYVVCFDALTHRLDAVWYAKLEASLPALLRDSFNRSLKGL